MFREVRDRCVPGHIPRSSNEVELEKRIECETSGRDLSKLCRLDGGMQIE